MKKELTTIVDALILSSCSNNSSIDGEIIKEERLTPNFVQKAIYNVPTGMAYTIKSNSGEYYIAIIKTNEDLLNTGTKGSFKLGEELFSGSLEEYINGKREERDFTAYTLDEYLIK